MIFMLNALLAAQHARIGPRTLDADPVTHAQIGIDRLRDTDRVAIAEIDHDVLPMPPFAVAVLHALAYGSAGKHPGYRRHGLTGAAADSKAGPTPRRGTMNTPEADKILREQKGQ